MSFHGLMEALQQPGCPACRAASASSRRWVQVLFHELVNDVGVRESLRRAGGFCLRHTHLVLELGNPVGGSIIYADLLRHALDPARPGRKPLCPVCELEEHTVRSVLETLLEHVGEEDVRSAYEASDSLCIPHLRQALALGMPPATRVLEDTERQKLAALADECGAFVAKSDYRNRSPVPPGEATAWRRAAGKLAGGCADHEP
jgi:hypothetical protein